MEKEREREKEKEKRCSFWLEKKKRFCANSSLPPSLFCGNHSSRSHSNWVPCPLDPSHRVLEENLDGHLKRCPLLKQARSLSLQPYYLKGINSGDNANVDFISTPEMKRKWVHSLTPPHFSLLLSKIRTLHNSIHIDIPFSFLKQHQQQQEGDDGHKLNKHVFQHSSIVANLEDLGALNHSNLAVVEFGAGRGYLTQFLAHTYYHIIQKVVLVERKSYKLKADRSLRQKQSLVLQRLRIDIEDLNLNAVESLRGIPYLAIGKHLCGPATDLALRCCLGELSDQDKGAKPCVHEHLRGIAVATCCHHLCQWKHYTNKKYLLNLGISKEEFHAITWFTSWAVDADHGSGPSNGSYVPSPVSPGDINGNDGCAEGVDEVLRNMKAVDRATVGFMCKDIIDMGRLMWIKEHGLQAKLVKYVPSNISPENRLLVASQ